MGNAKDLSFFHNIDRGVRRFPLVCYLDYFTCAQSCRNEGRQLLAAQPHPAQYVLRTWTHACGMV